MFTNKRIMIVVAHPDDELLGLGASMHKLICEKNIITHVAILGEGITSRFKLRDLKLCEKELTKHKSNIFNAQKLIGYHSINTYGFPDNRFDSIALLDIVKIVEEEKEKFSPDIIFTHHEGDLNVDHRLTFQAVLTAIRPMQNENVKMLITFETPSGTEWQTASSLQFRPNFFISVSEEDINAKLRAMEQYEYEIRAFPHPRSIEALKIKAQNRGIEVGCDFAEAFNIVRLIEM